MSTPTTPSLTLYRDRFTPEQQWERIMFRDGRVLQSAELNEIQRVAEWRSSSVSDALFADGNIVSGGGIVVHPGKKSITGIAGKIYLAGAIRDVPESTVSEIEISGTITFGVRLGVTAITEANDPTLNNPSVGVRGTGEPGAGRMKVVPYWSWSGAESTDPYYPIYTLDEGVLRPKEAPPEAEAITQAIAKYDVDSSGGDYIVSGCSVSALNTPALDGVQHYNIKEGRARVAGYPINIAASMRVVHNPVVQARRINLEAHVAAGGTETIPLNRVPSRQVLSVSVNRQVLGYAMQRGAATGTADLLPDGVVSVSNVRYGATNYTAGVHYTISGGAINWSLGGTTTPADEPPPLGTYNIDYVYLDTYAPNSGDVTETSVQTTGALAGSATLITYDWLMPRVDVLCLDKGGMPVFLPGTPAPVTPWPPTVPASLLPIAKIYQTWDARRVIRPAGVAMVPMETLSGIQTKLDRLLMLTAQDRLNFSAQFRDASLKKSVISDPFLDDTLRDQGVAQTAAIVDGSLMLAVNLQQTMLTAPALGQLDGSPVVTLEQTRKTGSMKINPYLTGTPTPAVATIVPSVDAWVEYESVFESPFTRRVVGDVQVGELNVVSVDLLSRIDVEDAAFIRQRQVQFTLENFAPTEELVAVEFDSVDCTGTVTA